MKTIYILLTRSTTCLSKFVHFVTDDMYTHVSFAFDETLEKLYSSSRKNGITMFPAGPCTENLQRGYYKDHQDIPCALYSLRVTDAVYKLTKAEADKIISSSDDYHFNIIGLLLCRLHIPLKRKRKFFCSQFAGEILTRNKALRLPKDPSLMRPIDYSFLPDLYCLFEGKVEELVSLAHSGRIKA